MPLGNTLPYGLRDIKLKPMPDGSTPGTAVDLPASRTLTFKETEDFSELRGDDIVQASHGSGPTVSWDMEEGGISLEAYAVMAGGAVVSSGVTPSQIKTYTKLGTDARPYFQVEGQAISDSGGDFHVKIYRCKTTGDIGGELGDAAFWLTAASGEGFPHPTSSKVYDFIQNETATAVT